MNNVIKVLVVDDSELIRHVLTELLSTDPGIDVVGTAPDPYVAREKIKALNPDVVTLDIEMPRMDGIAFLEKIMTLRPTPVIMVSTLTQRGAEVALKALELGAVDYVAKPAALDDGALDVLREELIEKVKVAARARLRGRGGASGAPREPAADYAPASKVVAMGASTGGVETLHEILMAMPAECPAILVVQHMPAVFTNSFAQRLDNVCPMNVREAQDGDRVLPGHVYLAPGSRHLELARSPAGYKCRLHDGKPVSGHRPSVDVLFESVARAAGPAAIGVILTGMGQDGAEGLLQMRRRGAHTIGEAAASCVVYGMPRAAMATGAVEKELPLSTIPQAILRYCRAAPAVTR